MLPVNPSMAYPAGDPTVVVEPEICSGEPVLKSVKKTCIGLADALGGSQKMLNADSHRIRLMGVSSLMAISVVKQSGCRFDIQEDWRLYRQRPALSA
jgi:hypothetical protein